MSRVTPVRKDLSRDCRDQARTKVPRVASEVADSFRTAEAGVKSGKAIGILDGIAALMQAEAEIAQTRRNLTFLVYAAGATPRQIAEEMGRRGHPMDHQTAYRWAKQAVESMGLTMADIREAPKH